MLISDKFDFLDNCDVDPSDILSCFELTMQHIGKNRADVFVQILNGFYGGLSLNRIFSVSKTYSFVLVGDCPNTQLLPSYSKQIYYIEQQKDKTVSITSNRTLSSSYFKPVRQLSNNEILLIASILCQECIKVFVLLRESHE